MPNIDSHMVNPVNDRVYIEAMDAPGPGGAHHLYKLSWPVGKPEELPDGLADAPVTHTLAFSFQKGPIGEAGINGITNEALLAIVQHRLECFQAGEFANGYNQEALIHVRVALSALKARTQDRMRRGVEGKNVK